MRQPRPWLVRSASRTNGASIELHDANFGEVPVLAKDNAVMDQSVRAIQGGRCACARRARVGGIRYGA